MTDLDIVGPDEDLGAPSDDAVLVPEVYAPGDADVAARAVTRAAEAAMAAPGSAGRDEFLTLCLKARMWSMSGLAPKAVRGKPYDALVILQTGRGLGLDEAAAMQTVHVIDGKPSLSVRLQVALLRRSGLGSVSPHPDNREDVAWAVVRDADGVEMGPPVPFSWEDAQRAGLVGPRCTPNAHVSGCKCKDNYRNYPADMLYWRAAGRGVRFYFPEVGLGVYSPDEMGAITDEAGEPIDPSTIALPAGYDEPPEETKRREAQAAAAEPADGDTLWLLQARIAALPEEHREKLRARWTTKGSPTFGFKPNVLPVGGVNYARSLVSGSEAQAKRDGYDPATAVPAMLEAAFRQVLAVFIGPDRGPDHAEAAPETPAAPDGPADPPAATETPIPENPEFDVDGPGDDSPTPADPAVTMAEVAAWLDGIKADVAPPLVAEIAAVVAAMSWQAVDKALVEEFGDPDPVDRKYPIDARRMTLVGYRLMAAADGGLG